VPILNRLSNETTKPSEVVRQLNFKINPETTRFWIHGQYASDGQRVNDFQEMTESRIQESEFRIQNEEADNRFYSFFSSDF